MSAVPVMCIVVVVLATVISVLYCSPQYATLWTFSQSFSVLKISTELITSAIKGSRTTGRRMVNIICATVKITFWELIDQTKAALLDFAVRQVNGFWIYLFVRQKADPEAAAGSAFFSCGPVRLSIIQKGWVSLAYQQWAQLSECQSDKVDRLNPLGLLERKGLNEKNLLLQATSVQDPWLAHWFSPNHDAQPLLW